MILLGYCISIIIYVKFVVKRLNDCAIIMVIEGDNLAKNVGNKNTKKKKIRVKS